jgi:hypothetical protein
MQFKTHSLSTETSLIVGRGMGVKPKGSIGGISPCATRT